MAGRAGTTKIELIAEAPASLQEANERLREYREELNARQERELLLRRYEKTIETMQLGVTVTDLEGLIVDINPADATMHGYSVDELIGQNASIFADSERKDPLSEAELKDMTSWRREGVNIRKDGSRFPVQLMSDVVRGGDGKPVGVVTTCEDITERKNAENALRKSETRYMLAATGASVGLWDWDVENDTVFYSTRWKSMLGYGEDEIGPSAEEWLGRIHPDERERVTAEIDVLSRYEGLHNNFEIEHRVAHKTGSYRWVLCSGVAVKGDTGRTERLVGSQQDITERKRVEQQLLEDAFHDALTGLPNRLFFKSLVERCLGRSRRREDYFFSVIILDLDRFKVVNDSLGHAVGDRLLVAVARRLKPLLRPSDTMARFGTDQFGILLEDVRNADDPARVARRIQSNLEKPFLVGEDDREVVISASLGIASNATPYEEADALIRDADTAMHRSKLRGAAAFEVFDADMRQQAVERLQIETELRGVVDQGQLRTFYQPIMAIPDTSLVGFEALLRWEHPERGLLLPAEFLRVAEETDLIVPMGWWILKDACKQMKHWHDTIEGAVDLGVSVNLSGRQLVQGDAFDQVASVLEDTDLSRGALRLEMTETVMMEGGKRSTDLCNKLKELSVRLHMDDFGTGYSSLSYLHSFPLDILKIDRSFVSRMTERPKFSEIVRAIVDMAHGLGMKVVAEGVETQEQFDLLAGFGCDYAQGFIFSTPVGAAEAENLIQKLTGK
jgi:diguanylate cyclase (GGDEF)-like protein/PAS domain S-box-containing protein